LVSKVYICKIKIKKGIQILFNKKVIGITFSLSVVLLLPIDKINSNLNIKLDFAIAIVWQVIKKLKIDILLYIDSIFDTNHTFFNNILFFIKINSNKISKNNSRRHIEHK
jgi:hypothetical protein